MTWQVRSSNKMLILGVVFFIIGFAFLAFFPNFMSLSPDRVAIWLYALLTAAPFGLGLFSIIIVKVKDAIIAMAFVFGYSLILLVPVPQGYEETYYGGVAILIMAILVIRVKLKESKDKAKKVERPNAATN